MRSSQISKLTVALAFVCMPFVCTAQTNVDSLRLIWTNSGLHDTVRMAAAMDIVKRGYTNSNPDSARVYALKGYDFAKASSNNKWRIKFLNRLGIVEWIQGNYNEALSVYLQSLEILKRDGDERMKSNVINNVGLIYYSQGEYSLALKYLFESLRLTKKLGDEKLISDTHNNIGLCYYNVGKLNEAEEYFELALIPLSVEDDKLRISKIYVSLALVFESKGVLEGALDAYYKSQTLKEKVGDSLGIARIFNNIGTIYLNKSEPEIALDYFDRSLTIKKRLNARLEISSTLRCIGDVHFFSGRYPEATDYYQKSYDMAKLINSAEGKGISLLSMGRVYYQNKQIPLALYNFNEALKIFETHAMEEQVIDCQLEIAELYYTDSKQDQALKMASVALERSEYHGFSPLELKAADLLYQIYKSKNMYSKSLELLELKNSIDSNFSDPDLLKEILNKHYVYKYQSKKNKDSLFFAQKSQLDEARIMEQNLEIENEKLKSVLMIGLIILLSLMSIFLFYVLRQRVIKNGIISKQKKQVEFQLNEIEQQQVQLFDKNIEITQLNFNLETLVESRTAELKTSLVRLEEYHYDLVHNIRGPLTSLIGLINLIKDPNFGSVENEKILRMLRLSSTKIDLVIKNISASMSNYDKFKNRDKL